MEPVSLIIAALAAGTAAGLTDVAQESVRNAVRSAHRDLRERVRARLAGREDGNLVLDRFDREPDTWERPLQSELVAAGAAEDAELIAAAQRVLTEAGRAPETGPKYRTNFHGEVGSAVIGDAARVNVTVNRPDLPSSARASGTSESGSPAPME
ncbi:hypothetical protein [Streptomyces sp. NPDC051636]|uniref:hypothetical protein n=1 Tax=Streptomyces sp. NPDC051636 TaxID=3365663 RepID=UPI003797B84C